MDDAGAVRRFERIGNLNGQLQQLRHGQRPGFEPGVQRLPFEQLHHQVAVPVVLADVVDGRDVRMVERRDRARLAFEPPQPVAVGREGGRQDLDRDAAPEPRIARTIDLAHPAGAEQADDFIRSEMRAFRERHGLADILVRECAVRGAECGARCGVRGAGAEGARCAGARCGVRCDVRECSTCAVRCHVRCEVRKCRCDSASHLAPGTRCTAPRTPHAALRTALAHPRTSHPRTACAARIATTG